MEIFKESLQFHNNRIKELEYRISNIRRDIDEKKEKSKNLTSTKQQRIDLIEKFPARIKELQEKRESLKLNIINSEEELKEKERTLRMNKRRSADEEILWKKEINNAQNAYDELRKECREEELAAERDLQDITKNWEMKVNLEIKSKLTEEIYTKQELNELITKLSELKEKIKEGIEVDDKLT